MTALVIIGIIVVIVIFFYIGYYLWSVALEKYDYNIFSLGMIIRGLLSFGCVFFAFASASSGTDDGSSIVLIITALVLWVWTFTVTWYRTNIFIALFSIVYQLIAIFFINSAIKRLLN